MIWRWLLGQRLDPGSLSRAWLANTERLAEYVAWNEREASGSIETHAFRDNWAGARAEAHAAMKAERHQSYLERTQSVVGCSRRGGTGIPTAPLTA